MICVYCDNENMKGRLVAKGRPGKCKGGQRGAEILGPIPPLYVSVYWASCFLLSSIVPP